MEEVAEVAVTAYERVKESSDAMSDAIYAALDAIDVFKATADEIAAEQGDEEEANIGLVKRMKQFSTRATAMVATIEDRVLDDLNFCMDRVFSVELAERGEFI